MENWYYYQKIGNDAVRIVRVFGTESELSLPYTLCGRSVTEIGSYCFSGKEKEVSHFLVKENGEAASEEELKQYIDGGSICALAGEYLTKVILPDTVESLGNLAFYQCRNLEELTFSNRLTEIGSDVFMNCRKLRKICIRGSVFQKSGLKQILAQRMAETLVTFIEEEKIQGIFLYPEYSETYDLIGPAHIFELNINGEGFRARQCFEHGILNTTQFDKAFLQECAEEREETLCQIACYRLRYPVGLTKEFEEMYHGYLEKHLQCLSELLIKERDLEMLFQFGMAGFLSQQILDGCIKRAVADNWTEGIRNLLAYKKEWQAGKEESEYEFDEF